MHRYGAIKIGIGLVLAVIIFLAAIILLVFFLLRGCDGSVNLAGNSSSNSGSRHRHKHGASSTSSVPTLSESPTGVLRPGVGGSLAGNSSVLPDSPGVHIWAGDEWVSPASYNYKITYKMLVINQNSNNPGLREPRPIMSTNDPTIPQPIPLVGTTIKIGTRSMGLSFQDASWIALYPLVLLPAGEEYAVDQYGFIPQDAVMAPTQNLSHPEDNYTLVEIDDMPPSPTGLYLLEYVVDPAMALFPTYAMIILEVE
ncbi:hypothetical protein KJ836_00495 [Patescibacteria group bacterium]|nr:hypothetical protein [Patescibacteria group bacterium]